MHAEILALRWLQIVLFEVTARFDQLPQVLPHFYCLLVCLGLHSCRQLLLDQCQEFVPIDSVGVGRWQESGSLAADEIAEFLVLVGDFDC